MRSAEACSRSRLRWRSCSPSRYCAQKEAKQHAAAAAAKGEYQLGSGVGARAGSEGILEYCARGAHTHLALPCLHADPAQLGALLRRRLQLLELLLLLLE